MRIRTLLIIAAAALAVGATVCVSPLTAVAVRVVWESLRPERIDWESKTGWRKCNGAIAGRLAWPGEHEARCRALSMCAAEAPLSPTEREALLAEAVAGDRCADF